MPPLQRLLPLGVALAASVSCGAPEHEVGSAPDAAQVDGPLLDAAAGLQEPGAYSAGDASAPEQSSDVTDAASSTDAAVERASLEAESDASSIDAAMTAGIPEIPLDAGSDGSLADLPTYCSGAADVFNVTLTSLGPFPDLMSVQATNLSQTWTTTLLPLEIIVSAGTAGTLSLTTALGFPIGIATYAEPINHTVPRPYLDLTVNATALTASGDTSGSFEVLDLETSDAGGGTLISLLVSFDITVPSSSYPMRAVGCMRYGSADADSGGN